MLSLYTKQLVYHHHLATISPAMDDLVTYRLSPLIIPPSEITKNINCV